MHRSHPVSSWPEDPYPGTWPDHSYVVDPGTATVHPVEVDAQVPSGWVVRAGSTSTDLDAWLAQHDLEPLDDRQAVLSFGSNRCPAKVARQGGPWVNLVARTQGLAAVWSHGTRGDGQVVATLVGADDHEADYFVSLCSARDLEMLDVVEGRGTGYDLVPLDAGQIVLEDGTRPDPVHAYVGLRPHRWPLAGEDGLPIALDALDQSAVAQWRSAEPRHWEPHPEGPFRPLT